MHAVHLHAPNGEHGEHGLTLGVVEPKRHAAVRAEVSGSGNELRRQSIALQRRLGTKRIVRREKTDQAVHATPVALHAATARSAPIAASTSASVLNHPKPKRTVPAGKVPSV